MKFEGEWISCEDQLPPEDGMYFVTCEYLHSGKRFTDVSIWEDRWEINASGNDMLKPFKVVAWAKYPKPWSGASE